MKKLLGIDQTSNHEFVILDLKLLEEYYLLEHQKTIIL